MCDDTVDCIVNAMFLSADKQRPFDSLVNKVQEKPEIKYRELAS